MDWIHLLVDKRFNREQVLRRTLLDKLVISDDISGDSEIDHCMKSV